MSFRKNISLSFQVYSWDFIFSGVQLRLYFFLFGFSSQIAFWNEWIRALAIWFYICLSVYFPGNSYIHSKITFLVAPWLRPGFRKVKSMLRSNWNKLQGPILGNLSIWSGRSMDQLNQLTCADQLSGQQNQAWSFWRLYSSRYNVGLVLIAISIPKKRMRSVGLHISRLYTRCCWMFFQTRYDDATLTPKR